MERNKNRPGERIFKQFYIAMTNRCNLKCSMCTTTTHPHELEKEISLEQWKAVINNVTRFKTQSIGFGGGEPLIRAEELSELVNIVASKNITVNIITNATLLSDMFLEKIMAYKEKSVFILSLDGMERDNDLIRGKGVFNKVMKAIGLLQKYEWPFSLTSVLMPENLLGYVDFLSFLACDYPDIYIDIQPVIPHNEVYHLRKRFELSQIHLEALKTLLSYLHNNEQKIKLCRPVRMVEKYWDYFTNTLYSENQCKMGTESFNINLRGNIWICGKELEYPLYEHGLEDVLSSKEYLNEIKRVENCKSPCLAGLVI